MDTQEVEGANSVLQRMATLAPGLRHALASDRLRNRKGDSITAAECCALHEQIMEYSQSQEHAGRFENGGGPPVPNEWILRACEHMRHEVAEVSERAERLQRGFAGTRHIDATFAYAWHPPTPGTSTHCFIPVWTYYSKVFVTVAEKMTPQDDAGADADTYVDVVMPVVTKTLSEDIISMVGEDLLLAAPLLLNMWICPLRWVSKTRAVAGPSEERQLRPAATLKRARGNDDVDPPDPPEDEDGLRDAEDDEGLECHGVEGANEGNEALPDREDEAEHAPENPPEVW